MDIVTKKYKLSETGSLPEKLKELIRNIVKENHLDTDKLEFWRKGYDIYKQPEFVDGERAIITYITTGKMDRDHEIIKPLGIKLDEYNKHRVVLAFHDYKSIPVGENMWIRQDTNGNGLVAKTRYTSKEANPLGDQIYQYRKEGFPLATSIGFLPTKYVTKFDTKNGDEFKKELDFAITKGWVSKEESDSVRAIVQECVLIEYSDVSVPANPDALQIAVNKGIISKEEYESEMKTIVQVDGLKFDKNINTVDAKATLDLPLIMREKEENIINIKQDIVVKPTATETQVHKENEEKSVEPPIFNDVTIKVQDNKGNPGMRDIAYLLSKCLNSNLNSMKDMNQMSMDYACVDEIYPINYPDGRAIFCCYGGSDTKYMDYPYTYDRVLNECTINMDKGTEVINTYVPKKSYEIVADYKKEAELITIENGKSIAIKDCFGKQYIIDVKQQVNEYEESRKTLAINSFPNFKSIEPLGREQWEKIYVDWIEYFLKSIPGKETITEFCKAKNLTYKGISDIEDDSIDEMDFIEMKPAPEETANEIRIRVRDPKDFEKNSFKYKVIKADKPRVAAIFAKLKGESTMTLQSYRFPKSDWTLEEAKAWVKEHSKKEFKFEDEFDIKQAAEILKQILDEEKKNTFDLMENFARRLGRVQL